MILGMYGSPVRRLLFFAGEPDITYVLFDMLDMREEAELEAAGCWLVEEPATVDWMAEREV